MRDVNLILDDHMREDVRNEQGFRYWHEKRRRVLMKGEDGTEAIFQLALFSWCRKFIVDSLAVYAEPSGLGQDKTDIIIVTPSGSYVIEVKWLGKNEAGTTWGESRIGEGLRQVKLYLDNDAKLVAGYLVIYDARLAEQNRSECRYADNDVHPLCTPPTILFLESETPSVAARAAAERRG
jgi:hypothetical protein